MHYQLSAHSHQGTCEVLENTVRFTADTNCEEARFQLNITFSRWEDDCYVLMPGCVYNGNRYPRVFRSYPPMYHREEMGENGHTAV